MGSNSIARIAMPHKHATEAQIQQRYHFYLLAQKRSMNAISILTANSAHVWAQWTLCPSLLAHAHCTAQHSKAEVADEVSLISKLLYPGYCIYTLFSKTICQFICFPIRHTATIQQASLCWGWVWSVLEPNWQSTSSALTKPGNSARSQDAWGKSEYATIPVIQFRYILTVLVIYSFHTDEARGGQRERGGERGEKNHCMSIELSVSPLYIVSIPFNGTKVQNNIQNICLLNIA